MLAVVLPRAAFAGDPNSDPATKPYKNFVSQWGNDPIWTSTFVSGPTPKASNFPLARTGPDPTGNWLPPFAPTTQAHQAPGPFHVTDLPHPALGPVTFGDSSGLVDIAPHDAFYDSDRRLWYCDIEMNFGASYYPFIRLALARYQPTSLPGAHLSNIVLADFMALTPDRWLNVSQAQDPKVRAVALYGHSYSNSSSSVEAKLAPSSVFHTPFSTEVENPADVSPTCIVEVWVEKLVPGLGEDFGWKKEPGALITPPSAVPHPPAQPIPVDESHISGLIEHRQFEMAVRQDLLKPFAIWPTLWNGSVTVPQVPSPTDRFRLVVAEYEEYLVDDVTPYNSTPSAKDHRLVFVDHVELIRIRLPKCWHIFFDAIEKNGSQATMSQN
jgi:hypothetical protein